MAEELEDRVADAISRQAIADLKFTQLLSDRLIQSRERFKKEGDGGTLGALQAIRATRSYFEMKRPDWAAQGLLNPIAAIEECLNAALNGKSNNILKYAWAKRPHNAPTLSLSEYYFRGTIGALVDLKLRECPSLSHLEAANSLVGQILDAGWEVSKKRNFELPLNDARTILRWRKRAMEGDQKDDPDALAYFHMLALQKSGPSKFEELLLNAFDMLRGIMPPVRTKV